MRAPSPLLRRSGAGLLLVIAAAGCRDTTAPTADTALAPPASIIIDAARGGQAGFFWLPPMVKQPTYTGTFDATLTGARAPYVSVAACPDGVGITCGDELVRLPATLDAQGERYRVNWDTKAPGFETGTVYRLSVRVPVALGGAPHELGLADVQLAETGGEARNITNDQVIGLVDGRTLPVAFRIEQGLVEPTLTVTSLANDGPGSLRAIVRSAPPGATIRFADDLCAPGATWREGCAVQLTAPISLVRAWRVIGSPHYQVALSGRTVFVSGSFGGRIEIDRVSVREGAPALFVSGADLLLTNAAIEDGRSPEATDFLGAAGVVVIRGLSGDFRGSNVTMRNVALRGHVSTIAAAALWLDPDNELTLEDSRVEANSSDQGQNLYLEGRITIRRTLFANNVTVRPVAASAASNIFDARVGALIEDSRFIGNVGGRSLLSRGTLVRSCGRDNAPGTVFEAVGELTECPVD